MTSPLGINVTLPTGTATEYQRRRDRELERRRGSADQPSSTDDQHVISRSEGDSDGGEEAEHNGQRPIGIDLDQEIVPFKPSGENNPFSDNEDSVSNDNKEVTDEDNVDEQDAQLEREEEEDDEISQSPPSSMPLLSIDLEELTGCKPSSADEKEILVTQVREALIGQSTDQAGEDDKGSTEDAGEQAEQGLYFTERAAELFDMGAASHCDTIASQKDKDDLKIALLEYPEFLAIPSEVDAALSTVMATSRIWKILKSPHRIAVVERLLSHLSATSRDIVWRYQMNIELRQVAKVEDFERKRRERAVALEEWTSGRRKLELERLYQVRETFEYRLNAARRNMEEVVGRREERVRAELARRREAGESGGGVDGLDFVEGASTFVFGDEAAGATKPTTSHAFHNLYEGDEQQSDPYKSDESGYELEGEDSGSEGAINEDEYAEEGEDIAAENRSQARSEATAERRRMRAARSSKRMRKRLARQEEESKRRAMIEAAKAEERRVREMCTLPEEQIAKAVVDQLDERMGKVDDLLEQIQEEEWAAEEEDNAGTTKEGPQIDVLYDNLDAERHDRPLLDQILAMILGATRPSNGRSKEEHYEYIRDEHLAIVSDWWDHFGRLPLSLSEQEEAAGLSDEKEKGIHSDADDAMLLAGSLNALRFDSHNDEPATDRTKPKAPQASQTPELMRSMLGISDNADDDWDDVADWDEFLPDCGTETASVADETQASVSPHQQRKPGLRPGGRL